MPFKYNPTIADIFAGIKPPWETMAQTNQSVQYPVFRTLPGGQTYSAPMVSPAPQAPVTPDIATQKPTYNAPASNTPQSSTPTTSAPKGNIPPQFINPKTGTLYSPQEFAEVVGNIAPQGMVPNYAGDVKAGKIGAMTTPQLEGRANVMNNARNDISTGTTDPYNVASTSGIAYSPAELSAIEKAYAGVYDPALQDVFIRLKTKEQEDQQKRQMDMEMAKMAKQFEYEKALKQTPTYGEGAAGTGYGGGTGGYVEGENPIVDAYVERINKGGELLSDVLKSIPGVKNQALRDAITIAAGQTRYDSAKSAGALETVNKINQMLSNPQLANISGFTGQLHGGLWGEAKKAKDLFNNILAELQTQTSVILNKGQGQVSNYERELFKQAATSLTRGQSDADFRQGLINMRAALLLASGQEANMQATDPKTGKIQIYSFNRDELMAAEKAGAPKGIVFTGAE